MSPRHLLLALAIVFIWGLNFAIIKLGLRQMSPLAMVVARFALSAFPLIFLVARPKAPVKLVFAYSFFIFALQFGLLFIGMNLGMSAGLSSLILQLQVFFTIGLAVPVLAERPTPWQALGAALAFSGIGVVAAHVGGDASIEGLALLIAAAACWGAGNVISRVISVRYGSQEPLGLVCWGSLFAIPPLVAVAFAIEGHAFLDSFVGLDWMSIGAVAYIAYLSTIFGYAGWSILLGRYPVAMVAPFTLLVPVFGFLGSHTLLGEPLEPWKFAAAGLVILGLLVNLFGGRLTARRA